MFNTALYTLSAHSQCCITCQLSGHSGKFSKTDWGHARCMRVCWCVSVWVRSPYAFKGFWWVPQGSTISTKRQELASPPIMTSPPQMRVRWSFLNQGGKRRRKVAGWKEKEETRRVLPFVEIKGNSWYSVGHEYWAGLDQEAALGLVE